MFLMKEHVGKLISDVEERFPFRPHAVGTRLNLDGSICDQ